MTAKNRLVGPSILFALAPLAAACGAASGAPADESVATDQPLSRATGTPAELPPAAPQGSKFVLPCQLTGLCQGRPASTPAPATLPDLIPARFLRGIAQEHAVGVRNVGNADAGASSTFVDYGPSCREHVPTPPVAVGSWAVLQLSLPDHCFLAGASYTIVVDEDGVVAESDETNNTLHVAPLPLGDGGFVR